jgi:hypothetical protein
MWLMLAWMHLNMLRKPFTCYIIIKCYNNLTLPCQSKMDWLQHFNKLHKMTNNIEYKRYFIRVWTCYIGLTKEEMSSNFATRI